MLAVSIVALIGYIALGAAAYRHAAPMFDHARIRITSWGWYGLFGLLLLMYLFFAAKGMMVGTYGMFGMLNLALVAAGCVSLWRENIRRRLAKLKHSHIVEVAMLVLGSYLTVVALEAPSNPYLTDFALQGLLAEIVMVTVVICALHLLFQRSGVGGALGVMIFEFVGLAEYFVVTFKEVPIMVSDVFALGTAAAVGGTYTYEFTDMAVAGMALAVVCMIIVSLTPKPHARGKKVIVANTVGGLGIAALLGFTLVTVSLTNTFGIYVGGWLPLQSYRTQGFISSFVAAAQNIRPTAPKGYTNTEAQSLIEEYAASYDETTGASEARQAAEAQFDELQPTVIVIMNESFSDLSIYGNLNAGYNGPEFINSMEDTLLKGDMYASPYGGGTCNAEFEFLTGVSMAYFGQSVYPYMVYDLSGVQNLASQFGELGYTTTAMHPNLATNWSRDVVYEDFGFQSFLSIDDFEGAQKLRGYTTDAATYDKILELLANDSTPQFIFDVTMQNHGSYDTGLLPEEDTTDYVVEGVEDVEELAELNEYLSLVNISDEALKNFLAALEELDRPVVVVFFGDHQPKGARQYNQLVYADEESGVAHEERTHITEYLVWANYDVAGVEELGAESNTTASYLAAETLNIIGAPLTDYQKALLSISEDLPLINLIGYTDAEGAWYDVDTMKGSEAKFRNDLEEMVYYQMFKDGVTYQVGAGSDGTL